MYFLVSKQINKREITIKEMKWGKQTCGRFPARKRRFVAANIDTDGGIGPLPGCDCSGI